MTLIPTPTQIPIPTLVFLPLRPPAAPWGEVLLNGNDVGLVDANASAEVEYIEIVEIVETVIVGPRCRRRGWRR